MFTGTIASNIAYGSPDATREQIERAARDANCEFVWGMPQGFDTEGAFFGVVSRCLSGFVLFFLSLLRLSRSLLYFSAPGLLRLPHSVSFSSSPSLPLSLLCVLFSF